MAASNTEIANLALSHIGVGKEIANLETEDSQEANACRRFYDTARDATLRDFAWPFASKFTTLGLVAKTPAETDEEWDFSYRYPSDCVLVKRVQSGIRNDTRQSRAPYKIARDATGLLIYTDEKDAKIEYTMRETDPIRYPADFVMAFSLRLAVLIAPRLTGGDPFRMGQRAMQLYAIEIRRAQAAAGNEEQIDEHPDSEFIRTRE